MRSKLKRVLWSLQTLFEFMYKPHFIERTRKLSQPIDHDVYVIRDTHKTGIRRRRDSSSSSYESSSSINSSSSEEDRKFIDVGLQTVKQEPEEQK